MEDLNYYGDPGNNCVSLLLDPASRKSDAVMNGILIIPKGVQKLIIIYSSYNGVLCKSGKFYPRLVEIVQEISTEECIKEEHLFNCI